MKQVRTYYSMQAIQSTGILGWKRHLRKQNEKISRYSFQLDIQRAIGVIEVLNSASQITAALQKPKSLALGPALNETILHRAYEQFTERFDEKYGGFGGEPKFPTPHNLSFLLRYWKRTGNDRALLMVNKTLQAMRSGGIYDHIGFGFHRYSTDSFWLVPHFEKMLYDQALLAIVYTEAYQATKKRSILKLPMKYWTMFCGI